ncbi:hypothetical protein AMECASPLE_026823, partial [Ameca splendens]
GQGGAGAGVKPPKPGYGNLGGGGVYQPGGVGTGLGPGGLGVVPGGGQYPAAAKAAKYGVGPGGVQTGVVPGYGGGYPQQYYPGVQSGVGPGVQTGQYAPAPLTPQQAKAAKYGALQGFLGGGGGGGGGFYRGGVAGCQGKYCGRRK